MATNVSYATTDTVLESLVLHTLPDFGPHGDGIINNNFLLAFLKQKGKFDIVEGGLEFWNGVMKANNSNFKWQASTAPMLANLQDPTARLRFDIKTFTGSVVINKLHEAQNKGRAMIKEFARTLREQAESTIPNQFNSSFWAASPGDDEPQSVPSLISITPTTGTIGGLSRSAGNYLQNIAYTTAVADIGAEAGIYALMYNKIRCAQGQGGKDSVDLAIMGDSLFAGLIAYLDTRHQFRVDDNMAKLGFDTAKMGGMTISYENTNVHNAENTINASYIYGINSNHMKFKVLRDGNFVWNPDGFERVGQTLNKALYFWVFCNLTTNLPCSHFVMTNVSTT